MPVLKVKKRCAKKLTAKQEAFVSAYLETGNASEAYRQAYDAEKMSQEALHVAACRLMQNPNVTLRIEASYAKVRAKAELTALDILNELDEARELAKKNENPTAMVAASMGRAKIAGLVIDKKELGGVGDFKNMSNEELDAFLAEPIEDEADYANGSSTKH